MSRFQALLRGPCPLIGVLHLPPLPGAPLPSPGLDAVLSAALRDAEALAEGGARGVIVENLGDAPFSADRVEPHVAAMLAVVARAVRERFGQALVVGVNALRNDACSAIGAAAAAGADFVRVNVLSGAMVTDQGIIEGRAREVLLYRNRVAPDVRIVADVLVKHAAPLAPVEIEQVAADTYERAGADVLVVTGAGTGRPTDPARLGRVRAAVPKAPVWVGSGVTLETALRFGREAHGAIVGTALHADGDRAAPLELERVRVMALRLAGG